MAIYKGDKFIGVNALKERKVYVEVPEGSTIDDMSDQNTIAISSEQYKELQDAVGYRVGSYKKHNVPEMIQALKEKYYTGRNYDMYFNYHNEPWTRPQGWPDLDSLNLQMTGNDFIYMTYDNTDSHVAVALHIEAVSKGTPITCTIGHISNGEYIIDETIPNTSNNYVKWLDEVNIDYPVIRVTGDITYCYSYNITKDGGTQHFRKQPILERIAYVPHLIKFCTGYSTNAWGVFTLQRDVINNGDGNALTSLYYAWAYCRELRVLDISGLKTQNVTNMDSTFRQLLKFTEIDLSHLNVSKVTTMSSLFNGSRALNTIDLTGWNTLALNTVANMFDTCLSLKNLYGIENFNTAAVTSFSSLFGNCRSLESLDISEWNTGEVTNLNSAFIECRSLQELNLSNWNVNKVITCSSTFAGCRALKLLNLTGWHTDALTSAYSMFYNCQSLQELDVSGLQITSTCASVGYMFQYCYSLKEIDVTGFDVSGIADSNNNAHDMFSGCWSLEKITGIRNFHWNMTNSLSGFFANCYNLKELDVSGWYINNITSLNSCFANCEALISLDLSNWQPQNCTNLTSMFSACTSLVTVGNISNWNTSKVQTMNGMFRYCYSLQEFPSIENWDYSEVINMEYMFSECYSLEKVIWRNVSLPACTNMQTILRYCYSLKYADLSGWSMPILPNSTSYYHTLGDCWALRDVIGFPIPASYTKLSFTNCEHLSHDSLLRILNALPNTTAGHTLYLTSINLNSLTTEERLIATNKNWTLAN